MSNQSDFSSPSGSNPAWYALKVRTGSEPVAATALSNRGYAPFCPTYLERRRYSDRMKLVPSVFFPGYLFCKFDIKQKLGLITSQAIEYIVGTGGVPTPVPEAEIECIRRAVEAGGRPAPYLRSGERVRVEYGALQGIEGIFEKHASKWRLIVSIHLLERSVSLHIHEDQVRFL